jgi:hypothetical protein
MYEKRGPHPPRFFVVLSIHRHSGAMQSIEPGISRFRVRVFDAPRNDSTEQTHIALGYLVCYMDRMFRDRPAIAARVVLDDRSRLPWRFFGRLTTSALAA